MWNYVEQKVFDINRADNVSVLAERCEVSVVVVDDRVLWVGCLRVLPPHLHTFAEFTAYNG